MNARAAIPKQIQILRGRDGCVEPDLGSPGVGVHGIGSDDEQLFVKSCVFKLAQNVDHNGGCASKTDGAVDPREFFVLSLEQLEPAGGLRLRPGIRIVNLAGFFRIWPQTLVHAAPAKRG